MVRPDPTTDPSDQNGDHTTPLFINDSPAGDTQRSLEPQKISYGALPDDTESAGSSNGDRVIAGIAVERCTLKVQELERSLSLLHTVSIAVSQIIGSGIFVSPNGIIIKVGSMGVSMFMWLIGGLFALCGALCFAELGALCPKSGGEFQYIKMTYGRMAAFANLWVLIIVSSMGPAVIALTFSQYFLSLFMDDGHPYFKIATKSVATLAILVVVAICIYGTKAGVRVQNFFMFMKFLAIGFLVILGVIYVAKGNTQNIKTGFEGTNKDVAGWSDALLSSLWAYNGWTSISVIASEVKNPKKNLPRALIITGVLVTLSYLIINLSYHSLLSPEQLKNSQSIAVLAGETFFSEYGTTWLLFGRYFFATSVALSTFGALLSMILAFSRLPHVGTMEHMLPSVLGLVSRQGKTPITSLMFLGFTSVCCVWPGNIFDLIIYVGFLSWIFWGMCFAAVFILRIKRPDMERPFRVPLFIPVIAILSSLYLVLGSIYAAPLKSGMWVLAALIAVPVYYGYVDKERSCDRWSSALTQRLLTYFDAGAAV